MGWGQAGLLSRGRAGKGEPLPLVPCALPGMSWWEREAPRWVHQSPNRRARGQDGAPQAPGDCPFLRPRHAELEALSKARGAAGTGCQGAVLLLSPRLCFCSLLSQLTAFFSCFITTPGHEHAGLFGRSVRVGGDFDVSSSGQGSWKALGHLEHQEVQLKPTSQLCWQEAPVAKPSQGFSCRV